MTPKWIAKLSFSAKGRHQFRPLFATLCPFLSPRDPSQKWCQKLASQRRAQSASTCCQLSENDLQNGCPVAAILTQSVHKWPPSGTGRSQERLREDQGTPRYAQEASRDPKMDSEWRPETPKWTQNGPKTLPKFFKFCIFQIRARMLPLLLHEPSFWQIGRRCVSFLLCKTLDARQRLFHVLALHAHV